MLLLGGLAVLACLPPAPLTVSPGALWPARLALGHLIGSALMAWIVTLIAVLGMHLTVVPVYLAFGAVSLLALRRSRSAQARQTFAAAPSAPRTPWTWVVIASVLFGLLSTGWTLISDPGLSIDANTLWAKKAKAFFLAGSLLPLLQDCCHKVNYPLLIPLHSWWIYSHLHHVDDWWHQLSGFLFFLDLVVLTFAFCRTHVRPLWAWMAASLVANSATQFLLATRGFADSALSAYLLASAVCLLQYLKLQDSGSRTLTLLFLLGALQTKNEGVAWAAFCIIAIILFELQHRNLRRASALGASFLIALAPWTIFRHAHAVLSGPDEPMATAHTLALTWAWRLGLIFRGFFADLGPPGLVFPLILCLPLLWRGDRRRSLPLLALLSAQLLSYFVICFIVQDPVYQVNGFAIRGISHIVPALLCVALICSKYAGRQASPELRAAAPSLQAISS